MHAIPKYYVYALKILTNVTIIIVGTSIRPVHAFYFGLRYNVKLPIEHLVKL